MKKMAEDRERWEGRGGCRGSALRHSCTGNGDDDIFVTMCLHFMSMKITTRDQFVDVEMAVIYNTIS